MMMSYVVASPGTPVSGKPRFGLVDDSDSGSDGDSSSDPNYSDDERIGLYSPPNKLSSLFVESLVNELPGTEHLSRCNSGRSEKQRVFDTNRDTRERLRGGYLIEPSGNSPSAPRAVEVLSNEDVTVAITEMERAMEEQFLQSSRLKRQELQSVLVDRSRSLQASERCRAEELRQEAEIRRGYEVDVAKFIYNIDLTGQTDAQVAASVQRARQAGCPLQPLSTSTLEAYTRRKLNVELSQTCEALRKDLKDISTALDDVCGQVDALQRLFPVAPSPSSSAPEQETLKTNLALVERLADDLRIPCIDRLLQGKNPTLVAGSELVSACRVAMQAINEAGVRAAEAERVKLAKEQREREAAEARELALLQRSSEYKEREKDRHSTSCCSFQLPYVKEREHLMARTLAPLRAKALRCTEAAKRGAAGGAESASDSRLAAIGERLDQILESLAAVRSSPRRPAGTTCDRVCAHEYCVFVLAMCERVDSLIKEAAQDRTLSSTGDTVTWIVYTLVDTGIVQNLMAVEAGSAATSTLSELELQMCHTYAYVVYGIYKLMGDNLKKVFGQIIQCILNVHTTTLAPNFSQWVDADIALLAKMLKAPVDPAELTSTKQHLLKKSGKFVTFYGSLLRFRMDGFATATEALTWFVRATQQLLLLVNIGNMEVNPMVAAVIVEHCCHVLKLFCYVSAESVLECPKSKTKFLEYSQELVRLLPGTTAKLSAAGAGGSPVLVGSITMIGKCVDIFVQDVLSKVLVLDVAVLSKFSASNFAYSSGAPHVLMSYGLISSVKKYEVLVERLDTSPTPQEKHVITEVVQADQLDGSIMNQLGPSAASQERVLKGITDTLARSMGPSAGGEIVEYTLFKVAFMAVKQSATPFFLAAKHAVPLARVVCSLCKSNPMICDLVVAQFYLNCPLALPNVLDCDWKTALLLTIPVAPGAPDIMSRESRAYKTACACLSANRFETIVPKDPQPGAPPPAARYETRDKFMSRMIKIFSTFCYIMVQPEATPLGPADAWRWLSGFVKDCLRFKDTLPFMVASTLDTFLRVTSPTLFATYGRNLFFTTLTVIKEKVCPKLDSSTGKLKIEAKRLEEFLHSALTSATNGSAEPVFKEL